MPIDLVLVELNSASAWVLWNGNGGGCCETVFTRFHLEGVDLQVEVAHPVLAYLQFALG